MNQYSETNEMNNDIKIIKMKMFLLVFELLVIVFLLVISAIMAFSKPTSAHNKMSNQTTLETVEKFTTVYNTGKVYLNWIVSNDAIDCVYIIERAADGIEFKAIGVREGIGSPLKLLYGFIDKNPLQGIAYYRLKKLNLYGAISYSEPFIIINKENNTMEDKSISLK